MYFNFLAGRVICAPTCGKSSAAVHPRSHTTFSENAAFQWRRTVQRFAVKDHLVDVHLQKAGSTVYVRVIGSRSRSLERKSLSVYHRSRIRILRIFFHS